MSTPRKLRKTAKGHEPEPPKSKRYGDRTPAWAEWLQRTNPAEYARRFAGHPVDFSVK
jgi:hypothetical protein